MISQGKDIVGGLIDQGTEIAGGLINQRNETAGKLIDPADQNVGMMTLGRETHNGPAARLAAWWRGVSTGRAGVGAGEGVPARRWELPFAPSIRWRLTIFNTTILALMLFTFSMFMYYVLAARLIHDIEVASQDRAEQVRDIFLRKWNANVIALQLWDPYDTEVWRRSEMLANEIDPFRAPGVGVRIYNPEGRLINGSAAFLMDLERIPEERLPIVRGIRYGYLGKDTLKTREGAFYVYSSPVPVLLPNGTGLVYVVQIFTSLQGYQNTMDLVARLLALGTLAAILIALVMGGSLAQTALAPISQIIRTAEQIDRAQDLSRRIAFTGPQDEIGRLAGTVNSMLDRIQVMFDRERQFLADVSHELRTPLTTIRGEMELMAKSGQLDPEGLEAVQAETERMSRMVGDLLLLARADSAMQLNRVPVELDTLLLEVYRGARTLAGEHHTVELGHEDVATVLGDRDRLKQMLLNLVDNALKYTPPGSTVTLSLFRDKKDVRLVVADNGPGIPPADQAHIFERFYRVDKARARASGGTGLGLSIVQWIATAHGGTATVKSVPGTGSSFVITLPLAGTV